MWGFRLAWSRLVASGTGTSIDQFKQYLDSRFDKHYSYMMKSYVKSYIDCFNNPSMLLSLKVSDYKYNNILKALVNYSKFLGCYEEFRSRLKASGIHYKKQNALLAFLRIMDSENHKGLGDWYKKAHEVLLPNEKLYLRYVLLSGLRREEATQSFNLLTAKRENYYNTQTGFLEHFRIKEDNGKFLFLRGSKNAFISAVPETLITEINKSEEVTYFAVTKRLYKHGLKSRFQELRSFYATTMRTLGLLSEQIDVCQGRINGGIFLQFYFKQNPKTLCNKILRLLPRLEAKLKQQT